MEYWVKNGYLSAICILFEISRRWTIVAMKFLQTLRLPLLAIVTASAFPVVPNLTAQILVNETFNTGVTFTNWYWTGGFYENPPSFPQAWNKNTATNQFFTTSFNATTLNVGQSITTTFEYNPASVSISTVRVGLFNGTAASANGWNQYDNSTAPSSTWQGYIGTLAIGSGNSTASLKGTSGTHPFFGNATGSSSAAQFFGNNATRAASLTLDRTAESITVSLAEGANFASLSPVVSYVDSTSAITNFNILSFYFTTTGGNGDIRYDTITTQVVPEPSVYALLALGVGLFGVVKLRSMRRKTARIPGA
jgi:hypothetical protein